MLPRYRKPDWRSKLNKLNRVPTDDLHTVLGVGERFHRFREVSGVPATEAALAQLNERLATRGALPGLASARLSKLACALHAARCVLFCGASVTQPLVR